MKKEIEIPDGYEAKIVGNKVVLEPKESEDERINRAIFKALSKKEARDVLRDEHIEVSDALAYLERQKDEAQRQFNLGVQAGKEEVLYEMEKEQKPAEWSEEDSDMICEIIGHCIAIPYIGGTLRLSDERKKELKTFVKSLRPQPQWKPSDKQLSALERCLDYLDESDNEDAAAIGSLCRDLKNL